MVLSHGILAGQRETVHLPLAELAHEGLNLLVRRARPVVAATVLPALIILGIFTFVRLVETAVENVVLLGRIEAIRRYYATLDPAAAAFFPSAGESAARRWPAPACALACSRCSSPAPA
jgi:hypothetical protein